jgi:hypothetical protein
LLSVLLKKCYCIASILTEIDARLERFERQAEVALTSLFGLFVMLAVTGYAMVLGTPL